MADDTQQQQPQAPPDLNAAIQALIQQQIAAASGQGNQVQLPSAQPPPSQYSNDPSKGPDLLERIGLALGGGSLPGAPAELRAQMGRQGLLNFGIGLMSAGKFATPGEVLAGGLSGARQGLLGSEAAQAGQQEYALNAQTKLAELGMQQQKNRTEALTGLMTALQMQGRLNMPPLFGPGSAAAGGGGGGGGGYTGDSYEGAIGGHEGAGQNPNSSAFGTGQFLAGTWNQFAAANPDLFKGMTPEQILAARANPQLGNQAITWLAQKNAQTLQGQGVRPTGQSLGIAHYLGAGGAAAVMGAPDSDPVSKYVSDAAVKANPELATMTVGQMKARYANTPNPGFLTAGGGGPATAAGGPGSAVGPYKPPGAAAAPAAPPGVQMGGAPPAPPGAAPGAPEAGGGIGLALNPPTGRDAATVTPRPGASRRSAAADAILQGIQTAQAEPAPPGTALAAGPAAGTPPAAQAAPTPEPGWGAQVGSYDTGAPVGPVRPPAATAEPPAQAAQPPPATAQPAQPPAPTPAPAPRAHDYSVPDTDLNPEEYQDRHFVPLTAEQVKTYAPGPAGDLAASAADQVQRERANLRVQQQLLEEARRLNPNEEAAQARQVNEAQGKLDAAENTYNDQVQKLAQSGASNLLNRDNAERARVSADYKASVVDPRNAAALKAQEGRQAIELENVKTGNQTSQHLIEAYNSDAANSGKRIDDLELLRGLSDNAGSPTLLTSIKVGDRSLADIVSATGFGGKDLQDKAGAVQAFRAGVLNTVRELRTGGAATGEPRSNQDLQFVQDMAPNEWQSPATRNAIISFLQQINQRRIDMAGEISRLTATRGPNGQLMPAGEAVAQARKNLPDFVQTMPADAMGNTPDALQKRRDFFSANVSPHSFFRYPNGRIDLYNGPGG